MKVRGYFELFFSNVADNMTMTNFLHFFPTCKLDKISNMLFEVPRVQYRKFFLVEQVKNL